MATVQNMQEINMIGDEMHRTENVAPSLSSSTTLNCAFFFFISFFISPQGVITIQVSSTRPVLTSFNPRARTKPKVMR